MNSPHAYRDAYRRRYAATVRMVREISRGNCPLCGKQMRKPNKECSAVSYHMPVRDLSKEQESKPL